MKVRIVLLLFIILICKYLHAQIEVTDNIEKIIGDRLENLAMNAENEDVDYTFLTERLSYYYRHPIKLDEKCEASLRELQLLSNIQIKGVLDHISKYGVINRIEELQQVESLSVDDILNIAPFVEGGNNKLSSSNSVDKASKHHLRMRYKETVQKNRGIKESKYKGDKYALYSRYTFNFEKSIIAGFTLEKDVGEVINPNNRISDFQSAFLQLQPGKKVKKIIIGDFKAGFGQGLTFTNSGGISKSSEVLLIGREIDNISPYRSVNESGYLRGLASEITLGKLNLRSFYSSNKQDATIENTPYGMRYSSLYQAGLHRTDNEMAKVNTLNVITSGLSATYDFHDLGVGVITALRKTSLSQSEETELYKKYLNNENRLGLGGLSFRFTRNNVSAFSEISHSYSNGNAALVGLLFMPDKNVGISILARQFDHNFISISSISLSEKSAMQNEEGIYSGIRVKMPKRITFSAYADIFKFKHPTFQSLTGGSGLDYFVEIKRKAGKDKEWLIQLKQKEKPKDFTEDDAKLANRVIEIYKSLRLQFQCLLLDVLRFRSRVEFTDYSFQDESDQGLLMFQEIKYSELGVNWSILLRYTLFDTESYNSRVYTYEQNVQGAYSIPSFSGKGSKIMALMNYKIKKGFKFSLKVSRLVYDDRKSIGSGYDEISGPEKTEITGQFDLSF